MSYKRYFVGKIVTLLFKSVYCSTVPDTLISFAGFRYLKILSLKGKNNNNSLEKQSETSESSLVAKMRWDEHSISRKKNSRFFPGFFLAELKGNRWEPSGEWFLIVIFPWSTDLPISPWSAYRQLFAIFTPDNDLPKNLLLFKANFPYDGCYAMWASSSLFCTCAFWQTLSFEASNGVGKNAALDYLLDVCNLTHIFE